MKPLLLLLLAAVVVALLIAGFAFLGTATGQSGFIPKESRTPALISGLTCLGVGTGLLVFGVFVSRKGG